LIQFIPWLLTFQFRPESVPRGRSDVLLRSIADDRNGHAWELALCGLRRGEIAGLRWSDVDLGGKTLSIANNRVDAGGKPVENDPKSAMSRRTLPLPDRLVSVLRAAKARRAAERLAGGVVLPRRRIRRE
jgi:integrase